MIDASVIEKIRKLRAITAQRGATEDEAIAAQQRMFTLLAKYNLELSEIPDDQPEKPDQSIEADYSDYRETVLCNDYSALSIETGAEIQLRHNVVDLAFPSALRQTS